MFVVQTDFDGLKYNLPNLSDYGSALQTFIDDEEEKNLRKLIGGKLYSAFIDGLDVVDPVVPEQRWIDLRDGKVFEYNDDEIVWVGMKKLLTPLIHSKLLDSTFVKNTGVTPAISKVENAKAISNITGVVNSWNDYVTLTKNLYYFLTENESDYPDLKWCEPENKNTFGL